MNSATRERLLTAVDRAILDNVRMRDILIVDEAGNPIGPNLRESADKSLKQLFQIRERATSMGQIK